MAQTTEEHESIQKKSTSDILTEVLENAKAPAFMIRRARIGYYDDFKSPISNPIHQLVYDARQHGLIDIAERAKSGEFDAQDWEAEAWTKTSEGQEMMDRLLQTLPPGGHPWPLH